MYARQRKGNTTMLKNMTTADSGIADALDTVQSINMTYGTIAVSITVLAAIIFTVIIFKKDTDTQHETDHDLQDSVVDIHDGTPRSVWNTVLLWVCGAGLYVLLMSIATIFLYFIIVLIAQEGIQEHNDEEQLNAIAVANIQENIAFETVEVLSHEVSTVANSLTDVDEENYILNVRGKTANKQVVEMSFIYDSDVDLMLPIQDYDTTFEIPVIKNSQLAEVTQQ